MNRKQRENRFARSEFDKAETKEQPLSGVNSRNYNYNKESRQMQNERSHVQQDIRAERKNNGRNNSRNNERGNGEE